MLLKKIITAFVSAAVLLNSSSAAVFAAYDDSVLNYNAYDMTRLDGLADTFYGECLKNDNDAGVADAYYELISEYNSVYDANVISMIQYNLKATEESYKDYSDSSQMQGTALRMILDVLQKAYVETSYSELIGYLSGLDDETSRMEIDDNDFQNEKIGILQRYHEIKQDSTLTDDEMEYLTAQLYIEYADYINKTVQESGMSNTQDYFYQIYNRDYSYSDIERLGNSVKSIVRNYFNYAVNCSRRCSNIPETRTTLVFDDNIEMLSRYASKVSDEAAASAALLKERGLYFQGGNPGSTDMTYTVYLFSLKIPVIYQYLTNSNTDFGTLVHEFGHFNAMYNSDEFINYIEVAGDCIDIAELQSQGMTVLFTKYYENIYGEYAMNMELYTLYNMLHTVASAFLVNDIERYVFENAGSLTPDQVVEKFNELKNEYEIINFRLSDINHIFEMPFYYISYGVSALAAFELWDEMYRDRDKAQRMYDDISHVNIYNVENRFVDSIERCGFSADIFDPRTVSEIMENVVYSTTGDRLYGDVDESSAVSATDIIYLMNRIMSPEVVTDERELKKCDLDRDGEIGASDLAVLKNIILK